MNPESRKELVKISKKAEIELINALLCGFITEDYHKESMEICWHCGNHGYKRVRECGNGYRYLSCDVCKIISKNRIARALFINGELQKDE